MVLSEFVSIDHDFAFGRTWSSGSSKLFGQSTTDFGFSSPTPGGKFSTRRARQLSTFLSNDSSGSIILLNNSHQKPLQKIGYGAFLGSSSLSSSSSFHENNEKIQHAPCSDRKRMEECDQNDSDQHCIWNPSFAPGDAHNVGDGECLVAKVHIWPEGLDLITQLSEVFLLEGSILFTAWYLRRHTVEIWHAFGFPTPDYDTRLKIWWYPASALYAIVGFYFYKKTQGWDVVDILYFLAQLFSTVGYGDIYPNGQIARLFTIGHIFLGIALVGGACGDQLDVIFASRIDRATYAVAMAADFKDLLPSIWEAALHIRSQCQNDAQYQTLVQQLFASTKNMKFDSTDISGLAWLEQDTVGRLIYREVTGTGHMISWPQGATRKAGNIPVDWTAPAPRLRSILACLELADASLREAVYDRTVVPELGYARVLNIFSEIAMADTFLWENLRNSAMRVFLLVGSGTLFFGVLDGLFAGHQFRTSFEGSYMSIVALTTVGFGEFAAHTTLAKLFSIWFFSQGTIIMAGFLMYLAEAFSYKGASTLAIVKRFSAEEIRDMQRLKEGEKEDDD